MYGAEQLEQAWPWTQLVHAYTRSFDLNWIGVTNIYIQLARVYVENSITESIILQSQYYSSVQDQLFKTCKCA